MKRYTRDSRRRVRDDGYTSAIVKHFSGERLEDKFFDVVKDVIDRINFEDVNEDNIDDYVWQEIDNSLIYTADQWTVMAHYQSPEDANFNEAMDEFTEDIRSIVEDIISERE